MPVTRHASLTAAMDTNIQRALNDKLYDKRKTGALEYVSPHSSRQRCIFFPFAPSFDPLAL